MNLRSLPNECLIDVLTFLDRKSLYKCLYVNRQYCKLSIPIIWKEPFKYYRYNRYNISVINALLACLDEDEITSLIPCEININNQSSLFEYGKFVSKIDHEWIVDFIVAWLSETYNVNINKYQDCRVQKLVNVIYHIIMRQGSNLQELNLYCLCLPKFSILTTYKPGIANLRAIDITLDNHMNWEGAIEFLSMLPKFCNGLINMKLLIHKFSELISDIIKSQP